MAGTAPAGAGPRHHILTVLVENKAGVLARVSSLFARRAKSPETRARTPARFCTSTDRMWSLGWAIRCPPRRGR